MLRTVEEVRRELEVDGLLLRYRDPADRLRHSVGDRQRPGAVRRGVRPGHRDAAGQLPQALTHLSHIAAAVALEQAS